MRLRPRLAAIAVGTFALAMGAALPAAAATTPAPTISVAPGDAGVLAPGAALDVDVAITNHGSGTLAGGTLRISLEQAPIVGVSTLTDRIAHPGSVLQGFLVSTTRSPSVPAGTTGHLRVHLSAATVDSVIADSAGARLLGAELDVGAPGVIAYSTVTRIPKGFGGRVGFGTVVPITAPAGTTGVVPPAELDLLSAPGGAWDRAVAAAEADHQATVLLDPEVQASVRLAGSAAPGDATDLLDRLSALPNEVELLPYADGDVTLQRAGGAERVLAPTSFAGGALTTPVPGATATPTATPTPSPAATPAAVPDTAQLLGWTGAGANLSWPVPGTVGAADLGFLARSGRSVTILASTDVADTPARVAAGPHARVGSSSVLVADATASSLLATAAAGRGVPQNAALADLVGVLGTDALTHEAAAVLAVPARTGPAPELARVLRQLDAQQWIVGGTLGSFAGTAAPTAVRLRTGTVPADRAALARSAIRGEGQVRALTTGVRSPQALTGPQRLALLGVLSTAWREPQTGFVPAIRSVTHGFSDFVRNVAIDRASSINYVGGSGSLPVTLTNQLTEPVTVVLSGTASNGRLRIEGDQTVVIPAEGGARAKLPVKSISNGEVDVTLTLRTKDGHVIGTPSRVRITVNAGWEAIGAVVIVVALLALFGTGVYRNVRRARRRIRAKRAIA